MKTIALPKRPSAMGASTSSLPSQKVHGDSLASIRFSSTAHSVPGSSACDREATDEDDDEKFEFADEVASVAAGRGSAAAVAEDMSKNSMFDNSPMQL